MERGQPVTSLVPAAILTAVEYLIQSHPLVVGAVVVGSAGAILGYLAYPEPAMLIIGPFFLGLFVYLGWGMQKVHRFGF